MHALLLLREATTRQGILASLSATDNYRRVWARDAVVAGLAGMWANDATVTAGLRASIVTLAAQQGRSGQMPSNVSFDDEDNVEKVSYGGLVGRVDATTWWVIGLAEYLRAHPDEHTLQHQLLPHLERALGVLKAWEYNERGLVYVPLGGNWADEYVTQGYTLYDNLLRLWALEAAADVWHRADWGITAGLLRRRLENDFWLQPAPTPALSLRESAPLPPPAPYHPRAKTHPDTAPPYWAAALAPNGYDTRFDLAGNALALYLKLGNETQRSTLNDYITNLAAANGSWLLPVFHPIITPSDADWQLLNHNFAYRFKNAPHHFHNGGSWAIWLGWLGLGAAKCGFGNTASQLYAVVEHAHATETPTPYTFHEYWATDTFTPHGTPYLCYSAAGNVLLALANGIKTS